MGLQMSSQLSQATASARYQRNGFQMRSCVCVNIQPGRAVENGTNYLCDV